MRWLGVAILLALAPSAFALGEEVRAVDDDGESNYHFEPTILTASPGATVSVVGGTREPHTFTHNIAQAERLFDTGVVDLGVSSSFLAPVATGDYPFFCVLHPGMRGTLVVSVSEATSRTTPVPLAAVMAAFAVAAFVLSRPARK